MANNHPHLQSPRRPSQERRRDRLPKSRTRAQHPLVAGARLRNDLARVAVPKLGPSDLWFDCLSMTSLSGVLAFRRRRILGFGGALDPIVKHRQ